MIIILPDAGCRENLLLWTFLYCQSTTYATWKIWLYKKKQILVEVVLLQEIDMNSSKLVDVETPV